MKRPGDIQNEPILETEQQNREEGDFPNGQSHMYHEPDKYEFAEEIMPENIPSQSIMTELLGESLYGVWQALCSAIDEKYDMERLWNTGGKHWTYEYKYRRGGKTLCSLYAKSNCVGFMVILGKDERAKFEDIRNALSSAVCRRYDEAQTYHDGKWIMFEPTNTAEFDDYMKLLAVKRRPNRKIEKKSNGEQGSD